MSKKFSHIGQAFMLPIAILPVAGLLLGLGGALTNKVAVTSYPWLNQEWLQTILKIMNFAGSAVFNNLALIFSIGLAVGLAKGDKGTAGLAGGVAYLVYTATISGLLQLFSPKNTIDTGVLGAILIGSVVAYLHNHYRKVELPQFLGFFGGKADLYSQEINDIIAHPDMPPVNNPQVDKVPNSQSNSVHKSEEVIFKAPVKGTFEDISQVNDEVFSQKMMGEGFAIKPENGKIYSPVTATVVSIFKTKHAVGLKTESGLEVMLHLGIDTVELEGKPFTFQDINFIIILLSITK